VEESEPVALGYAVGESNAYIPELQPLPCVDVVRVDSCPGCNSGDGWTVIDLSEAAHEIVCGVGTCEVTIEEGEP